MVLTVLGRREMTGKDALNTCHSVATYIDSSGNSFLYPYTFTVYGADQGGSSVYAAPFEEDIYPPGETAPGVPYVTVPSVNIPSVWLPTESDGTSGWTTTTNVGEQEDEEESDYFEMRDEKEVRQLLSEVFLWLSGMGEYPEILAQVAPEEIVGDVHSDDENERDMVPGRVVAQVLRWALGEL